MDSSSESDNASDMETTTDGVQVKSELEEFEEKSKVVGYELGGYTVLPDVTKKKKAKVRRKLPQWLDSPDIVHSDIANKQKAIDLVPGISNYMKQKLQKNNITHLFPVQWQVIPAVMETVIPGTAVTRLGLPPRDICCSAPTGSGKTLSFVLPIVQVAEENPPDVEEPPVKILRSQTEVKTRICKPVLDKRCVICSKTSKYFYSKSKGTEVDKLTKAARLNAGKLKAAAGKKGDQAVLLHFLTDPVAAEMMYHRKCYQAYVYTPAKERATGTQRRLRALVVLPVADLALQVYKVFQLYCEGTHLKVGVTNGQMSFAAEQAILSSTNKITGATDPSLDILISTPGRLVDHIASGLDLSHLRFLVLDEVDRILEEVKHDWLSCVERAVYDKRGWPQPLTAARLSDTTQPLQKLLFSATLTENPEKLEKLNLCEPRLFTSIVKSHQQEHSSQSDEQSEHFAGKFTTPDGLQEYYTECSLPIHKPLSLLYMLYTLKLRKVLVFTGSQDTCSRLCSLLGQYGNDLKVEKITGSLNKKRRTTIIKQFMNGAIDVLVTTDLMTRGIDIEDVSAVISYDAPPYIKTYIHRVGRTARAGKQGVSYTLLKSQEVPHFRKMIKSAGKKVKARKLTRSNLKPYTERCSKILQSLNKRESGS